MMMGQNGPKNVGVSGFYNITVNVIQYCAFVGTSYSNFIKILGKYTRIRSQNVKVFKN